MQFITHSTPDATHAGPVELTAGQLAKIVRQQATHIRYRWVRLIIGLAFLGLSGKAGVSEITNGVFSLHTVGLFFAYYFIYQSVYYWNGDFRLQFIIEHADRRLMAEATGQTDNRNLPFA